jgi:hypothetical protein
MLALPDVVGGIANMRRVTGGRGLEDWQRGKEIQQPECGENQDERGQTQKRNERECEEGDEMGDRPSMHGYLA